MKRFSGLWLAAILCVSLVSGCALLQPTTDQSSNNTQQTTDPVPQNPNTDPSVNGKYSVLLQKITCESDRGSYGEFNDYGYWGGGAWCGQQGQAGYWVWVAPTWHVWKNRR